MSGITPVGGRPIDMGFDLGDGATPTGALAGDATAAVASRAPTGLRSVADLWSSLAAGATPLPGDDDRNLDSTGTRRPVALGENHRFTANPGSLAESPAEVGSGLFAAASLIDDSNTNLFDRMSLDGPATANMLSTLTQDLAQVAPGKPLPQGFSDVQALQLRSSGQTVMLELMTAKGTPEATKREAFATYRTMIDNETNPMMKDAMVLHLHRLRDTLPADLHAKIDEVKSVIGPDRPPYDAWFANGNNTVRVDWVSQDHGVAINLKQLKAAGYKVTSEANGVHVLEKSYTKNGVETKFEVTMRQGDRDMYKNVADGPQNMHVYTGHSDWGRNMRTSLEGANAGDGGDNKLVLTDLCVGKGEMQMFRDKFPDAHMVTTHNSSYFYEGDDSEGTNAFLVTAEGIAGRRGYEAIAADVHKSNPFMFEHEQSGLDNNFIFPTDQATRRKVLDADHDGQADVFDRVVDFNTFAVAEDTAREFEPIEPSRSADALVGTKVHFASQTINRLVLYSEVFENQNSTGKVVPNAYFAPKEGEQALFRFEKDTLDGKDIIKMSMNSHYAHMSEEALRMAGSYEYSRWVAANDPDVKLQGADAVMNALVLASHSLDTDAGHRDDVVWREFIEAYNLPDINRSDVEGVKEVNEHYYSGSYQSIDELRAKLDPSVLTALAAPGAGMPG